MNKTDTPSSGHVSQERGIGKNHMVGEPKTIMMVSKKSVHQWFGKDIGNHVRCQNPDHQECSIGNVFTNEMVTDIYMFCMGGDSVSIDDRLCTLTVT
jgi:hypothetical protein